MYLEWQRNKILFKRAFYIQDIGLPTMVTTTSATQETLEGESGKFRKIRKLLHPYNSIIQLTTDLFVVHWKVRTLLAVIE